MRLLAHYRYINWIGCSLVLAAIALPTYSQQKDFNVYDAGNIPRPWQARFKERLDLFVEYQRTKQWDKVSSMLGELNGGRDRKKYSVEERRKLIEQLSSKPISNFALNKIIFSTEILSRPLSKRWWYVLGTAEYAEGDKSVRAPTRFTAYRHKGEWFFSY